LEANLAIRVLEGNSLIPHEGCSFIARGTEDGMARLYMTIWTASMQTLRVRCLATP